LKIVKIKSLVSLLIVFLSTQIFADNIDFHRKTIIKTNVLNFVMLPSLHLEQQMGVSTSLQLNFHRGSIVIISPNEFVNASLNFRKYFKRMADLNKFYGAVGVSYHDNLLQVRYNNQTQQTYKGNKSIGPELRLGFQNNIKNSRWYFDANIGASLPFAPIQPFGYGEDLQARVFIGFGFRL